MYGDKVRGEMAGDLIQSTYFDALRDQKLNPAGQPNIHAIWMKPKGSNILLNLRYILKFHWMVLSVLK